MKDATYIRVKSCKKCGDEIQHDQISVCLKCENRIGLGQSFCGKCGTQLKLKNFKQNAKDVPR